MNVWKKLSKLFETILKHEVIKIWVRQNSAPFINIIFPFSIIPKAVTFVTILNCTNNETKSNKKFSFRKWANFIAFSQLNSASL